LFYGVTGELTTKPPITTPKPTLPPAPSSVDDDISVYVSGMTPFKVSYCFLFSVNLTIPYQMQKLYNAK
jgi:hypothetical protein